MYAYIDQPVERLCMGGRFLLWAMRGWSQAISSSRCPQIALSRGFAGLGVLAALPDFHIAMAMFNRDSLERISVAPMPCARIVEDEAILMGMWRDLALGDIDHMRTTLGMMVEEEAVDPVARGMTAVIAQFVAAGIDMSTLTREKLKEDK